MAKLFMVVLAAVFVYWYFGQKGFFYIKAKVVHAQDVVERVVWVLLGVVYSLLYLIGLLLARATKWSTDKLLFRR